MCTTLLYYSKYYKCVPVIDLYDNIYYYIYTKLYDSYTFLNQYHFIVKYG